MRVLPDRPLAPLAPTLPYARLSAFYFVYFAAIGAFSPYFSLWLDARGLGATAISLVMSLWYGARIVSPGAWSYLVQRSAQPIAWLRIGTIATLATFALFLAAHSFWTIVAVMAAFAFFCNAIMPQFEAITLSHIRARPTMYGRIRLWGSVGFIGVVAGFGWLFDHVSVAWLVALMLPIFVAIAAGSFTNNYARDCDSPVAGQRARDDAAAGQRARDDAAPSAVSSDRAAPRRMRETTLESLRRPGVRTFVAMALLMQVAHGAFYVFFALFLADHGYRASAVGGFWAVGVLAEIAMFWFAGDVIRKRGTLAAMRFCLAVAAVRFVATGLFADSVAIVALAQATHALTFGLFHASAMQRVTELFPSPLVGQGQGLYYGLGSGIGGVAGSLIAGAAWKYGGGDAAFIACGIAAAIGFVVAMRRDQAAVGG